MISFSSFKGDKLIGRSNYIEWKNNADLFLEINWYMSYIDGTETTPSKRLYYDVETTVKEGKETSTYSTEPFTRELGARYADRISEFNRTLIISAPWAHLNQLFQTIITTVLRIRLVLRICTIVSLKPLVRLV